MSSGDVHESSIDKLGGSGIIDVKADHSIGDDTAELYESNYSFEPKVTPEVQTAFNEEYRKAVDLYGEFNTINGVGVMTEVSTDEGNYNDNSRWISLRHAEKKNGLKIMASVAQEKHKNGKWSTGNPRHAMRHEIGHAIQLHRKLNDEKWTEKLLSISKIFQKAKQELDGYTMPSSYIGDDIDEFISECVAASFLNPKKQSKTVKAVFRIIIGGA